MIRREAKLADGRPGWLLIPQQEHARLSYELAAAWGNDDTPPLVCPPEEPGHPLAGVRAELLEAIRRHDDGWAAWWDAPGFDAAGKPYAFTEMPTADAQRVWDGSIESCAPVGPLAGWVVASHFAALQSKHDDDYPEWAGWLERVDGARAEWLEAWLAAGEGHTRELADRCLSLLQTFDWLSLWLCCYCPLETHDQSIVEPLRIGGDHPGAPQTCFDSRGPGLVGVAPWPFRSRELSLHADARLTPADAPQSHSGSPARAERRSVGWTLRP
ncbi:DUF3891 family protein [Botrimarina sp.]|uniref:DUF3891 family protein n=1 Tax=Botrimarina sp. TaxID=2795802 RepID=UPI0032EBEBD3